MNAEEYQKVKEIFQSVLEITPEDRLAFLDQRCDGNDSLRAEVERLLASYDSEFLNLPASVDLTNRDSPQSSRSGQQIGHYNILDKIGSGGMGDVYLAEDGKLRRQVAIKFLSEALTNDPDRLHRFEQEAQTASGLNHPNILTIYEVGETEDAHYIVTEYIDGETLRARLNRGRISVTEALDIAVQCASALSGAHENGIVHRDIKPENIMLRRDNLVKVLDFGLAKLVEKKNAPVSHDALTEKHLKTAPGVIMGTVQYMSPEQTRGHATDARTDIWSLGVVIYEMAAGTPPFKGENAADLIAEIVKTHPAPLSRDFPDVPDRLDEIVAKTLEKNADKRYQTSRDLHFDLNRLKRRIDAEVDLERSKSKVLGRTAPVTVPGPIDTGFIPSGNIDTDRGRRTIFTGALKALSNSRASKIGIVFFLGLTALITAFSINRYFSGNSPDFKFSVGKITRLTSSGRVKTSTVSPDGKFVVYGQEESDDKWSLWIHHVETNSSVQLHSAGIYQALTFTVDGNHVYYIDAHGTLFRIPVLGGLPKKITEHLAARPDSSVGVSPDGSQIAYTRGGVNAVNSLFTADGDGGNERLLASFDPSIQLVQRSEWSPDGKVIACWFNENGLHNILTVQVNDGSFTPLLQAEWAFISGFKWMADSKSLVAVGGRLQKDSFMTLWQFEYPTGSSRQITSDPSEYSNINVTLGGRGLAAVRTEVTSHIWTAASEKADRVAQLTAGSEMFDGGYCLEFMPSGQILYDSAPYKKLGIWRVDEDGKNRQELVEKAGFGSLSPDGRFVVWQRETGGTANLWRTDLISGAHMQLSDGIGAPVLPAFSPDGKWVFFTAYGTNISLWRVSIDGGEPILVSAKPALGAAVSPDGEKIAVILNKKIAVLSFDNGAVIKTFETKPLVDGQFTFEKLQWTADGKSIYYLYLNEGVSNIWKQPFDGSAPIQVTKFDSGRIFRFAFSFHGKDLVLSKGTMNSDVYLIENAD